MAKDKTRAEETEARKEESVINPAKAQRVEPWPEPPAVVTPAKSGELRPVEDHAREQGLPAWELAALRQATKWAPGKTVSAAQFGQALEGLRKRRLGGGRIPQPRRR